ncbi:MAG: hypothetical protein AAFY42_12615 [Pseudomonadota bacterium]
MDIDRRQLIKGAAAAITAPTLCTLPSPAPATPLDVSKAANVANGLKAYAVGTSGEFNWRAIYARSAEEAEKIWLEEAGIDFEDAPDLDHERHKSWDDKSVVEGDESWFEAGYGSFCDRCSYECFPDDGTQWVAGKSICQDCLTLDDYRICDPEHYRELIEELMWEEYGPALSAN